MNSHDLIRWARYCWWLSSAHPLRAPMPFADFREVFCKDQPVVFKWPKV